MTKMSTEKECSNITQEETFSDISTSSPSASKDHPPSYDATVGIRRRTVETVSEQVLTSSDEEKILNLLREIVRKCTVSNPIKRPTAREILKLIEQSAPRSVLKEKLDISEDEDEDEEDDD